MRLNDIEDATRGVPASAAPARLARLIMVSLIVAALVGLFWPTMGSFHGAWTDTDSLTYTHGYLIAAICVALLVRNLWTDDVAPRADLRFLPLLAVLSLCWLIAERAGIELAAQLLFPVIVFCAICAATGVRAGGRQWFACAYLLFAIPLWDLGNGVLQSISVAAVKLMLRISGIPAFVEGNVVHIPEGAFAVEGGCSGLHYFIVALAIAALFGEIQRDKFRVRAQLIALAVALALLSNWIRIYVVVVAGHLTDMQHYLVSVSHYSFGWVLFAATMGIFLWLASRMPMSEPRAGAPVSDRASPHAWPRAGVGVAAAAIGPLLGWIAPVTPAPASRGELLPAIAGWEGPVAAKDAWSPLYEDSDRLQLGVYRQAGISVTAFIAEYDEQRQGKEIVGYGRQLLNGAPGEPVSERSINLPGGNARWLQTGDTPGERAVVVYYYEIGAAQRVSPVSAQLTYALATLRGPVSSRIVAARMSCATECTEATEGTQRLLADLRAARKVNSP